MAATKAQKDAVKKYDANNTKQYHLKLNTNTDEAIIKRLAKMGTQKYIKDLIKADMKPKETPRMILKLTYNSGAQISEFVNYILVEDGRLCFKVDQKANGIGGIVKIPLENVKNYKIEMVISEGLKMPRI